MKPIRLLRRSEQLNLTLGLDSLRGKIYRCRYFLYVGRWYLVGELHRKDGPATEYADGRKRWWFDGEHYGDNDDFTNESWAAHLAKLK